MRGSIAWLGLWAACGGQGDAPERVQVTRDFADSCVTAGDGSCDELISCPLGTDSYDCDLACAGDDWPADNDGACAHDAASTAERRSAGAGTRGMGGPTGTWDGVVTVRGVRDTDQVDRHFRVFVPDRYDPRRPTPVLFALGGFTVDMYWMAEFTELDRAADRDDFIVVYGHPEYRDFGSAWVFAWYVYNTAFLGDWPDNPDIAYLEAVLDEVGDLYNVDTSRVYVSGHSRGAGLSIIAAFERPDLFAGFCAQAGFAEVNDYDSRMAEIGADADIAGVLIHGDADPDVPVTSSDHIADVMEGLGWSEDLLYERLPGATHEWQSQLNPAMWAFLADRPGGGGE
jgi:predicted esterase